jgi:flagellar assembly factor FliW
MTQPHPIEQPLEGALRVSTRFGDFDVSTRDILHFPDGIPGFEQCRRFVIVSSDMMGPLQCLHSVDGPAATFLAIDPRLALANYRCVLTQGDYLRLGADEQAVLLWLAIVSVDDSGEATVNLRAPIVINPARMVGYQVVPSNSLYPLRYPLTVD